MGHNVPNKGIKVDKESMEVIEKLPPPNSLKGLRCFLRHVSFYKHFIKDFSKIAKRLIQLLFMDVLFDFSEERLSAFLRLKRALIRALVMQDLDWELPCEVICDTSIGSNLGRVSSSFRG